MLDEAGCALKRFTAEYAEMAEIFISILCVLSALCGERSQG
jgi:hypothetical protein